MNIDLSKGVDFYFDDLAKRLDDAGVSHGEMEREMGVDGGQFSRWINKKVKNPRLTSLIEIEAALQRILDRRRKARAKSRMGGGRSGSD